ncbi:MAG TPA: SPOR domain-containing protein [Rudaea sp.]|jgi:DedD protein|uniref:SPOR domain-containing protein n=1 Tax=Rudaea sp. TaxID=2136325 RepID=UPI002F937D7B
MDSALKQRLVGAAVLIALAVIFLPMFFSITPPKQENTTVGLNIPAAPERNFETRNLAVDAPRGATPAPSAAASTGTPSTAATGDKVTTVTTSAPPTFEAPDNAAAPKPAATSLATAKPTPVAPPAAAPAPPPAPAVQADGRFLVNLGVYADAGGANALVARVKKLGYPAFAEATQYQGKDAQRVRVGPYADRAAAESVRLKIKQAESKVPSSVVEAADPTQPTPPATAQSKSAPSKSAPAPATTEAAAPAPTLAANRAGGYAVQVGAFKAEDEANKLRDRLRNGGVAAFIDKTGDGDQALWKVRAGPYADRGGADAALTSIKQKFQITGMIKTQP